jgi:heme exporter protein D
MDAYASYEATCMNRLKTFLIRRAMIDDERRQRQRRAVISKV